MRERARKKMPKNHMKKQIASTHTQKKIAEKERMKDIYTKRPNEIINKTVDCEFERKITI